MFEPAPRIVAPPTSEPMIRVGIVLPQDHIKSLTYQKRDSGELLVNGKLSDASATISLANQNQLSLIDTKSSNLAPTFIIENQNISNLEPGLGLSLNPIVAGRNFHWKQKIEAIFPGKLEFYNRADSLEVINELGFENYLACVVTSEMGPKCPIEFMKAQIIAARSWAYVFLHDKHPGSAFDVCNDDDCQRYQGSTFLSLAALEASQATKGEFLIYKDKDNSRYVVPSYYYKTCGGFTENPKEIYGFDQASLSSIQDSDQSLKASAAINIEPESLIDLPKHRYQDFYCGQAEASNIHEYLGKVDQGGAHFRWASHISHQELTANLREKCDLADIEAILSLKILERSRGARVTLMEIEYITRASKTRTLKLSSQYKIREALSPSFLPSSAFLFTQDEFGDFHFRGAGWGHGVGLCQVGGVMMALAGKSYKEILKHYFPHADLEKSY